MVCRPESFARWFVRDAARSYSIDLSPFFLSARALDACRISMCQRFACDFMNGCFAISLALFLVPVKCMPRAPIPSCTQQTQGAQYKVKVDSFAQSKTKRVLTPRDLTRASESELMRHLGENV